MEYFCAKCGERHSVTDIAADMWAVVKKEVFNNLEDAFQTNDDEGLSRLYHHVRKFVNDESNARKLFSIPGSRIESMLVDPSWEGRCLKGTFRISLPELLRLYKESGVQSIYEDSEDIQSSYSEPCADPLRVAESVGDVAVYEKEMHFTYILDGENRRQLIFDHVTDKDGDPFSAEGRMRGYMRICPHCGTHVSRVKGRAPEIVVAMAGPGRSGKTACVISILSALYSGRYDKYKLGMDDVGFDDQWSDLRKEIEERYNKGYQIMKTSTFDTASTLATSVIVRFRNVRRVVTFVDMPGEFWADGSGELDPNFFTQYSQLYENIDFIWYFITKLSAVQYNFPGEENRYTEDDRRLADETSERMATIQSSRCGVIRGTFKIISDILTNRGKRMPPVAVILTKTDVELGSEDDKERTKMYRLFPLCDGNDDERRDCVNSENQREIRDVLTDDYNGGYVLNEYGFFRKSIKVRNFFRNHCGGVVSAVEDSCPHRTYMSVSFYGHAAARYVEDKENNTPPADKEESIEPVEPRPFRELFPLFWVMACSGAIEIEHGCVWKKKKWTGAYSKPEEGSENIKFNAREYAYRDNPIDKMKPKDAENWQEVADLAANLLLEGQNDENGMSYRSTEIIL